MSTKSTKELGTLYLHKFECKLENKSDIVVRSDYSRLLKPFQIQGIRFLYKQYLKSGGAVLNDEKTLGKKLQAVLFLSALHSSIPSKQSLIICDEHNLHRWLYHFAKWSTLIVTLLDDECSENSSIVIVSVNQCNKLHNMKWNVVVVDNLDPITNINSIQNINGTLRIWLDDTNIKADPKKIFNVLQWVSTNRVGNLKKFETLLRTDCYSLPELWKNRQYFNILCSKWLLRRTKQELSDQLVSTDSKKFEDDYQKWLNKYQSRNHRSEKNSSNQTGSEVNLSLCQIKSNPSNDKSKENLTTDLTEGKIPSVSGGLSDNGSIKPSVSSASIKIDNSIRESSRSKNLNDNRSEDDDIVSTTSLEVDNVEESSQSLLDVSLRNNTTNKRKFHMLDSLFSQGNSKKVTDPIMSLEKPIKEEPETDPDPPTERKPLAKKQFRLLDNFFT